MFVFAIRIRIVTISFIIFVNQEKLFQHLLVLFKNIEPQKTNKTLLNFS